jgi:hypothetical protein
MDEINDIFASIVEGLDPHEARPVRYITPVEGSFSVSLPHPAREMIAELAVLAGFAAKASDAPVLYADADDQAAYGLLAGSAVAAGASHDCAIVKASVFSDTVTALELHAWLRVLNHIRSLITAKVTSSKAMEVLRESNAEAAHLLDFVGAVQHEVLEALI